MLAKLHTYSLFGIEARAVEVEVDISSGSLPRTILVGLAEAAVRESTHRIERALVNSGYVRPSDRIVISLSPADLPKDAASFDLPIALGLLTASGQLQGDRFEEYTVVGELALDGRLRPIRGVLSMALAAREAGRVGIVVPLENVAEAAVVEGLDAIPVGTLAEAVGHLGGAIDIEPAEFSWEKEIRDHGSYDIDYSDVKGQETAKRAVVVAAAGRHHLLMIGPPGTGKTLLARRLGSILPQLTSQESLETTRIWSAVGRLAPGRPLMLNRPFRSPHHTISEAGLVGGGSRPSPGEISLAHHGVLFLDELPEFNRRTLEVLRQPLEEHEVTISRALGSVTFPANLMMVAAMNPCPCGFRGDPKRECHCGVSQIERYMSKISGPLLDRIDIHVEVPGVPFHELADDTPGTDSESMAEEVERARVVQVGRFEESERDGVVATRTNGNMTPRQIRQYCKLSDSAGNLLKLAMDQMGLSARAHDRILRVSRTIADLSGLPDIAEDHLSEAINFRALDRSYWN